ncbi:ABC transporter substrate-binding protein [Anaerosporobacter faecicola]|uniref:ABC transporter substrate-binding protein n=1 Tax=Anaerosporobacter faecicola TaxID=2718714 RepID=UPI00143A39F7|nr:extracellular solute-binding protein [Anaerosporobacter faecicola]
MMRKKENVRKSRGRSIQSYVALLLCIVLVCLLCVGCKSSTKKEDSVSMGRYMEQELQLPEEYNQGNIMDINNVENTLQVYVELEGAYKLLSYKEGSWTEENMDWITAILTENGLTLSDVVLGQDGNQYILCYHMEENQSICYSIYKKEAASGKKLEIPWLEKKQDNGFGEIEYPYVTHFEVLADGSIVLPDTASLDGESSMILYDGETGEPVLETDLVEPMAVEEDFLIGYNREKQQLVKINQNGEEKGTYEYQGTKQEDGTYYYQSSNDSTLLVQKDGSLYKLANSGISILQEKGTMWQNIVEGDLTTLSDQTLNFQKLVILSNQTKKVDYAVLAYDSQYIPRLYYYQYDENVEAIPSKEINVYSLYMNSTIRQAITKYQAEHTDVKVNYTYAIENGQEGVDQKDCIRALNTELLAGNGADLLVLDGLPKDSYVEKNVLEDISDLVSPKVKDGTLSENVMNNYITEKGFYYLPLRIQVPVAYGNEELVKNITSLENMMNYVDRLQTDLPLDNIGGENFANLFWGLYHTELIKEDSTIDENALSQYLDLLKNVTDRYEDEGGSGYYSSMFQADNAISLENGFSMYSGKKSSDKTYLVQMVTLSDCIVPFQGVRDEEMFYDTLQNQYVESGLVGINKTGKNKKLAKEFLEYLLGDTVQSGDSLDGFPVNSKSLEALFSNDKALEDMRIVSTGEEGTFEYTPPKSEQIAELYEKVTSLNKPISYDCTLQSLAVEKVKDYIEGTTSKEETIQNIRNVVNSYLAE